MKSESADETPDVPVIVQQILSQAEDRGASDIHLEPTSTDWEVRLRVDGILQVSEHLATNIGRAVVTRLMVLAKLLTYRLDVPQEGRFTVARKDGAAMDMRLAVMPTTHGIRAVVRLPAELRGEMSLDQLGLPEGVVDGLKRFALADSGMLVITGPAGSGKTTTIYALLSYIAANSPGTCLIALEDPVERNLPGVTQIEVSPFGQLTYERALRSILRQDPQVLMMGEIRDAPTAALAVQAALSGHRLITTLHASNPGLAIARLLEMGIEPYQITSALHGVVTQRLARRKSPDGYRGRAPLAEFVDVDDALRKAILERADAQTLAKIYSRQPGYRSLADIGRNLIGSGITDPAEITRILGTS